MAVFHMILGWTAQALMFVLFLLFLAFLGYCLYLKHLHMKYDHIPGPPRNRYSKLALELKLAWCGCLVDANVIILAVAHVSLTPTLISVTFVFCFLSHTLFFRPQFPARTFTDVFENYEQWRDCARQISGMVSSRHDG